MSLVIKGSPAQLKQTTKPHIDIQQNQTCSLTSSVEEVKEMDEKIALKICFTKHLYRQERNKNKNQTFVFLLFL